MVLTQGEACDDEDRGSRVERRWTTRRDGGRRASGAREHTADLIEAQSLTWAPAMHTDAPLAGSGRRRSPSWDGRALLWAGGSCAAEQCEVVQPAVRPVACCAEQRATRPDSSRSEHGRRASMARCRPDLRWERHSAGPSHGDGRTGTLIAGGRIMQGTRPRSLDSLLGRGAALVPLPSRPGAPTGPTRLATGWGRLAGPLAGHFRLLSRHVSPPRSRRRSLPSPSPPALSPSTSPSAAPAPAWR